MVELVAVALTAALGFTIGRIYIRLSRTRRWKTTNADAVHAATLAPPPRRLAKPCEDCGELYTFEDPAYRRDARLLHVWFECPLAISQRQGRR